MENNELIMENTNEGIIEEIKKVYINITNNRGTEILKESYYWLEDIINSDFRELNIEEMIKIINIQNVKIEVRNNIVEDAIKEIIKSKYSKCTEKALSDISISFRTLLDKEYELFLDISKYILSVNSDLTFKNVGDKFEEFSDKYECLKAYEKFVISSLVTLDQVNKNNNIIENTNYEFYNIYNSSLSKGVLIKMLDESTIKMVDNVKEKRLFKRI